LQFEHHVDNICQNYCQNCHCVSIFLKTRKIMDGRNICTECYNSNEYLKSQRDQNLPIWIDNNDKVHYESPKELSSLTDGEKLLIQQVNSYVPLVHIKNGQLGIKGHVVAFPQHIEEVCYQLPRLPSDVTFVKVTQVFKEKEGPNTHQKSFLIRKQKVLDALFWLQKYNIEYKNITIVHSNLDWIKNGKEQQLEAKSIFVEDTERKKYDVGPSKSQIYDVEENESLEECYGLITQQKLSIPSSKDNDQTKQILQAINKGDNKASISFPYVESEPVDEFNPSIRLFCKAFPWLFPGGYGDINDFDNKKRTVNVWMKNLLYFFDGRFARDKMWCFYAQDYQLRQNNTSSGGYFIDGFFKNGPQSLEELKRELRNGNTSWLDQITYFSNRIPGSPAYWRTKKNQVYSWINHHIENNHGPPTLFITLSCAEYFWPEVKRLIQERFTIINMQAPSTINNYVQTVNDYTLIVQELFQKKVMHWLETVGKEVFQIEHYWGRYEFTKQRGQIHTHLLAITKPSPIHDTLFLYKENKRQQAQILQKWVEKQYKLTATIPSIFRLKTSTLQTKSLHPASFKFSDISDIKKDGAECLQFMQQHHCSDYCLRKRQHVDKNESAESKKRRKCRCGAGIEEKAFSNNTPGFAKRKTPTIERDVRGFLKLNLPRNDSRVIQSSLSQLQSWRANCDIQIILYESNPLHPDLQEIASVTDYVVAYACKGNDSLLQEKKSVYNQIMQAESLYDSNKDIKRLARQILNKTVARRIISKQEIMVNLARLDLTFCSEIIENVSLSGSYKLNTKPTKTFLSLYANRPLMFAQNVSLHEYFNYIKNVNKKSSKTIIPHYIGTSCQPIYPPTRSYARSILLIFKPWKIKFEDHDKRDFVKEFYNYISSKNCHPFVKISYERQKMRVEKKTQYIEPTSSIQENDNLNDVSNELQEIVDLVSNHVLNTKLLPSDEENFEFGLNFNWCVPKYENIDSTINTSQWLLSECKIFDENDILNTTELPPKKSNGKSYELFDCCEDQLDTIAYILNHLRKIILYGLGKIKNKPGQLFMTIRGEAGSGKTVLVNTLLTIFSRMFPKSRTYYACGPTGCSAFNAKGQTCHKLFEVQQKKDPSSLSDKQTKSLLQKFATTLLVIADERSMIASNVLAKMEKNASITMHKGKNKTSLFGGLPMFLLIGDDYQIPPIMKGAFYSLYPDTLDKTSIVQHGHTLFKIFGKDVMELMTQKRQLDDQQEFRDILNVLKQKNEESFNIQQKQRIFGLHIMNHKYSAEDRKKIENNALYLFANREPRNKHNASKLKSISGNMNPVAKIKAITRKTDGTVIPLNDHYDPEYIPPVTLICINAIVQLCGINIMPKWGLFNGSFGTVKDIVFRQNENPNLNHQPLYVLVEFPQYEGPSWSKTNNKLVPIVPVTKFCNRFCCTRQFIPLVLAFGRTGHTFQGMNVGPVGEHQTPNMFPKIICDIGNKGFEGVNPGFTYSIFSRCTTIGNPHDKLSSSLYFFGPNLDDNRISQLSRNSDGKIYQKVHLRTNWVNFLKRNTHSSNLTNSEKQKLFHWANTSKYSETDLLQIIKNL